MVTCLVVIWERDDASTNPQNHTRVDLAVGIHVRGLVDPGLDTLVAQVGIILDLLGEGGLER